MSSRISKNTPIDANDLEHLIPNKEINSKLSLFFAEVENMISGSLWAKGQSDILNIKFCFDLHKAMFGRVWKWAGRVREVSTNIGCPWEQIIPNLENLFHDIQYWIEHKTYGWDEIAARFHHRLVSIHVFLDGNGRHAREMTDRLMKVNKQEPLTWGLELKLKKKKIQKKYIKAIRKADGKNFKDLINFIRS